MDNRQNRHGDSQGLRTEETGRIEKIPPRDKFGVAVARPAEGGIQCPARKGFCAAFQRYEKALEELAKV